MSGDQNNKKGGIGGMQIIIYALITILAISALYMRGGDLPQWEKCKESLVQQLFSNQCTPRSGLGNEIVIPSNGQGLNT